MSNNTVLAYTKDIKAFIEACEGRVAPEEYEELAAAWLTKNRSSLSPKTVGRQMTSLRSFARANKMDLDALTEYRVPKPLRANPHPLPEGIEGVRRMIRKAEVEDHQVIVALCGLAGLRIAEAREVRPSHIDRHSRMLTVRGKGDKTRRVKLSDACWEAIEMPYMKAYIEHDRALVSIGDRAARRAVTSLGRRAGLRRRVSSHDLRATFATTVYRNTKNLRVVQELLGHASVETTQVYLGVSAEEMSSAVEF